MRRVLAGLIVLIFAATAAVAQVTLPQNIPVPLVPSGLDASGFFTSRLVNYTDLNFGTIYGQQTLSTSTNIAQWGNAVYSMDSDPGFQVNTILQGMCLNDGTSFVIGYITAIDNSSGTNFTTIDVVSAAGGSTCNTWFFQNISGPLNGLPPSQSLALSTSTFALPVAGKTQSITVDINKGFTAGSLIFLAALGDTTTWCWAVVENYNSTTGAITAFVVQSSNTGLTYNNWAVGMSGTLAPFVPILGFSSTPLTFANTIKMPASMPGAIVGTTGGAILAAVPMPGSVGVGSNIIAPGTAVMMTTQTGLLLNNSHIVVSNSSDSTQYFRGIGQYNSTTGTITVYITDTSVGLGTSNSSWSLFAQDGPPVNASQIVVSRSSNSIATGDLTFSVQSGQNFPIQGPVTITALASQSNQMVGYIKAYSGSSMIVTVPTTGTYGSGSFTAWSILNTGPPQRSLGLYQISGLLVTSNDPVSYDSISIQAGTVRDSTDTMNLDLPAAVTVAKNSCCGIGGAVQALQPGTASVSAGNVTGTGTNFLTSFSATATLTDFNNQLTNIGFPAVTEFSIVAFSAGGGPCQVTGVTTNAAMTVDCAASGSNFPVYRGAAESNGGPYSWGVVLTRRDSDGVTGVVLSSFTASGVPDLPVGYTFYRVIAIAFGNSGGTNAVISQPLLGNAYARGGSLVPTKTTAGQGSGIYCCSFPLYKTTAPAAYFSGSIQAAALGVNVSNVDNAFGLITFASSVGLVTGQSIVITGAVPAGLTAGTGYYVCAADATGTKYYLYNGTQAQAYACGLGGRAVPSGTTTGWSARSFSYGTIAAIGFDSIAPVGATPGTTTMRFDFNLTNSIGLYTSVPGATALLKVNAAGLFNSTPTQSSYWLAQPAAKGSVWTVNNNLIQMVGGAMIDATTNVGLGTWGNQSTTIWYIDVLILGFIVCPPAWRRRDPANDNDGLDERNVA